MFEIFLRRSRFRIEIKMVKHVGTEEFQIKGEIYSKNYKFRKMNIRIYLNKDFINPRSKCIINRLTFININQLL